MQRSRFPASRRRAGVAVGVAVLVLSLAGGPAFAADGELQQPVDFLHNNLQDAPVSGAVYGTAPAAKIGTAICTTPTSTAANVNTDCEGTGPHNETSIAVNPTNAANMIGGANDYQLALNPGGHVSETTLSRAHVTFDGGQTWTTYPINATSTYQATGDPAVAFDAAGNAYYATLGFRFVGPGNAQNPDVLVSNSPDGGINWSTRVIGSGSGVFTSVGDSLDKEYIAAWGDGNAIVTYGNFRLGPKGSFLSARIHASVTHDAGTTWSRPVIISGSLDEAFVSTPTVTPDGRVFVSFLNTSNLQNGRDDVMVVEVDPTTGHRIGNPVMAVSQIVDGFTDYPIAFGRQTYQDSTFRTWAAGNITADPADPGHLAVVFSDMRNSATPAPADPYAATTDSDIVVSQSDDYGQTWSDPVALTLSGDQFMPWGAYDASGRLRIGFFDRSYDTANHMYGYTLATESAAGSLSFGYAEVTTARSDPTTGNRWFAGTLDADFPFPTSFLGDYSNIAIIPGGGVAAYWTDLREQVAFAGRTASGEDAFFGIMP